MQITDIGYGRGWLDAPAAASLARIDREIGHPLQITDAGRTRAQQQENYDRWRDGTGSFAAYPGTSPHEFGNAIDTNERLTAILARHGWWRPLGSEPWHYVYRTWADEHINDPTPAGNGTSTSTQSEEDDMRQIQIGTTIFSIAPGYIKAETSGEAASITRAVIGQPDPIDANPQPGGINKPDAVCNSYGIPWEKVEMVRDGRGYDLQGRLGKGTIWSVQHDILYTLRNGGTPGGTGDSVTAAEVADEFAKRLAS